MSQLIQAGLLLLAVTCLLFGILSVHPWEVLESGVEALSQSFQIQRVGECEGTYEHVPQPIRQWSRSPIQVDTQQTGGSSKITSADSSRNSEDMLNGTISGIVDGRVFGSWSSRNGARHTFTCSVRVSILVPGSRQPGTESWDQKMSATSAPALELNDCRRAGPEPFPTLPSTPPNPSKK